MQQLLNAYILSAHKSNIEFFQKYSQIVSWSANLRDENTAVTICNICPWNVQQILWCFQSHGQLFIYRGTTFSLLLITLTLAVRYVRCTLARTNAVCLHDSAESDAVISIFLTFTNFRMRKVNYQNSTLDRWIMVYWFLEYQVNNKLFVRVLIILVMLVTIIHSRWTYYNSGSQNVKGYSKIKINVKINN